MLSLSLRYMVNTVTNTQTQFVFNPKKTVNDYENDFSATNLTVSWYQTNAVWITPFLAIVKLQVEGLKIL